MDKFQGIDPRSNFGSAGLRIYKSDVERRNKGFFY